jgi:hypothetical protein
MRVRRLRARLLVVTALAAATAATLAAPVRADGDPASDVLYFQDVFLPFPKPAATPSQRLQAAVASANKAGFRIKVAIIASDQDLGSVPSLFGRPQIYAQFLGVELRSFYKDRLLVVMPTGFGVYRNGKTVVPEKRVLNGLEAGASADEITTAATTAVQKLRQAFARKRKGDSVPPKVKALASSGKRGGKASLRFKVSDNSGRAREELRVYGPKFLLYATLKRPLARIRSGVVNTVPWKVPKAVKPGSLEFCALAADAAGNLSTASCAKLKIS